MITLILNDIFFRYFVGNKITNWVVVIVIVIVIVLKNIIEALILYSQTRL